MLTPEAIYRIPDADLADLGGNPRAIREQAATRLLGTILEETDIAVIEPGVRERALMMSHLQRGSLKGELTRSFFLFKSFPIAMVTRHWARALSAPTLQGRSEEHTSELQSLMRTSYAVFCLKKKKPCTSTLPTTLHAPSTSTIHQLATRLN